MLTARVDPLLDATLDLVNRSGQINRLDVLPRPLVGDDRQHAGLLLRDHIAASGLLGQPDEVLVGNRETLRLARGALPRQLIADLFHSLHALLRTRRCTP